MSRLAGGSSLAMTPTFCLRRVVLLFVVVCLSLDLNPGSLKHDLKGLGLIVENLGVE